MRWTSVELNKRPVCLSYSKSSRIFGTEAWAGSRPFWAMHSENLFPMQEYVLLVDVFLDLYGAVSLCGGQPPTSYTIRCRDSGLHDVSGHNAARSDPGCLRDGSEAEWTSGIGL